ncbi:DNA polymerase III subunit gamma/tau [Candidatus Calescamantes bacterium]|nr:DNA polymerase III subunit gamma/tau [Candidatus Calescamantes bacterium]
MAYQVISRKWRPQFFRDVVGQSHVVVTLQNAIRRGRIAHAYLFAGPRGVGKTTTARILSKALNCEKGPTPEPCNQCLQCKSITEGKNMDVLEIDGASNRGIDEVRALRENVKFAPTQSRYKIYIIDEVHMLTTEAFNALLKTLEEPPPHVCFIFATTAPHKVPLTILSRCQRFDFHKIPTTLLMERLQHIANAEGIKIRKEALKIIAEVSDGSLRDAESILDQLASFVEGEIKEEDVNNLLGKVGKDFLLKFVQKLKEGNFPEIWTLTQTFLSQGKPMEGFLEEIANFLKLMLFYKLGVKDKNWEEEAEGLSALIDDWEEREIVELVERFLEIREKVKRSDTPILTLEASLLKLKNWQKKESKDPWLQILEKAKDLGKTLYATLKQSKPLKVTEKEIVISLPCISHYFENIPGRKELEEWAKKNIGKSLSYKFKERQREEEKKYDKIVEKAMELFNAKVIREEKNG